MTTFTKFEAADYLDNEEVIAEYLSAALEDENPDVFLAAVADIAKAQGMSALAIAAGLGRESLYKALAPGAKPRYDTVLKLVYALGVKLHVQPKDGIVGTGNVKAVSRGKAIKVKASNQSRKLANTQNPRQGSTVAIRKASRTTRKLAA